MHVLLGLLLLALAAGLLYLLGVSIWRWGLLKPTGWPSRVELKMCSNWTLYPVFVRTYSLNGTKRFWLLHIPFGDLWVHFEVTR